MDAVEGLTLEPVVTATREVRALLAALDAALSAEYLPEQRHGLTVDALFQPHIRFFIARLDGTAVGCGGVAFYTAFAEVKRMFVRDDVRGRGVARALLLRLEVETQNAGIQTLYLETGTRQADALRLYERAGFTHCDAFGAYATMPAQAVATSVFLEKRLDT